MISNDINLINKSIVSSMEAIRFIDLKDNLGNFLLASYNPNKIPSQSIDATAAGVTKSASAVAATTSTANLPDVPQPVLEFFSQMVKQRKISLISYLLRLHKCPQFFQK